MNYQSRLAEAMLLLKIDWTLEDYERSVEERLYLEDVVRRGYVTVTA